MQLKHQQWRVGVPVIAVKSVERLTMDPKAMQVVVQE